MQAKLQPHTDKEEDPALALCFEVFRYLQSQQPELLGDEHRDAILATVSVCGSQAMHGRRRC